MRCGCSHTEVRGGFESSSQGKLLVGTELTLTLNSISECLRPWQARWRQPRSILVPKNQKSPPGVVKSCVEILPRRGLCSAHAWGCCGIQAQGAAGSASPNSHTQGWAPLFREFLTMAHCPKNVKMQTLTAGAGRTVGQCNIWSSWWKSQFFTQTDFLEKQTMSKNTHT